MIVWSVVNIEEWEITRPMARQLSQPPMGQTPIPDMPNWTWYEYGMRVGFWRLMRALAKAGVIPTMSINAKVCETYPEVAGAARDAGWEFMAHSYVQMPIQQIEDQRAVIRQSIETIERLERRAQLFDQDLYLKSKGADHDLISCECRGGLYGPYALLDYVGEANIVIPKEPLQTSPVSALDLGQRWPAE